MKSNLDKLVRLEFRKLPQMNKYGQTHRVILHCEKHTYGGLFTFEERLTMRGPGGKNIPVREGDSLWLNYRENGELKNIVWEESSVKTN